MHGFRSDMEGSKAIFLHDWCMKEDLPFIRFDNLGCGNSSGEFMDQTISTWLEASEAVINDLCPNGAIIVGSSCGGWLGLLAAIRNPDKVKGLVCIAPAPDFTEDVWNALTKEAQNELMTNGAIKFVNGGHELDITRNLIEDGRKHLLLDKDILQINSKVRIIHGMQDKEVSYKKSLSIIEKITSKDALCTLVKTGEHRLSRDEDLELIVGSL